MNNLKPCPFCGGGKITVEKTSINTYYVAECTQCGARTDVLHREQVFAAWNNRAELTTLSQKPVEPRYENIDCTGLQRYFEPYSPVAVVYRNGQVLPDGSQITGTHDPSTNSFVLDSTPCEVCGNFKHIDCRADNLQFTAVHCPNCGRRLKAGEG